MIENVVIVGSGAAGLTAAIYAGRANLNPLLIEGMQSGGQLTITSDVENFPGFPEGILGPELMVNFRKQAERFGARIVSGNVVAADFSKSPMVLKLESTEIKTKTVILATGASANLLGLPNEMRLMGKGVSTCATCDGFFFRGLEIAVIGGGDSACEEASFLTKFASKVTLVHRRDQLRASKIMQDRVLQNPKIQVMWNAIPVDVLGAAEVEALRVRDAATGKETDISVAGVFVAIGHSPNTKPFREQLQCDAKGYIQTVRGPCTNVPGVFAAGDVQDSVYRQAITAAGSGCMAALEAERFLEGLHA